MATRTWVGNTGSWYDASQWETDLGTNSYPLPGDVVFINSGTVDLSGSDETAFTPVDAQQITLGATNAANPAVLSATTATIGHFTTIVSGGTAGFAVLSTTGPSGDSGTIIADSSGGTFTIQATQADGAQPADFVLLHDGAVSVSNGDNLVFDGLITTETSVTIAAGSTLTNDSTDTLFGGSTSLQAGSTLLGSGTFVASADATLVLDVAVPSTETVTFGPAGRLNLGDVTGFAGAITNFLQGNTIDLLSTTATSATYDATSGLLTIDNGGTVLATLAVQGPPNGPLNTGTDNAGGTMITYPGSPTRTSLEIATADDAMGSNVVRQTLTTATGAPITGSGIKIGIMSDSFNATLDGVVDPADTAAQQGYLPETTEDTSAVTILQDSTVTGVENEGLAMAELVHQVAPGAQLYFYTAEGGQDSFANGVSALVNAGVNIIVDDWSFSSEPFYQIAGPVDTAIENAISAGVNYFTAAGNYGDAYYESTWQPTTTQLVLQSGQPAQTVSAQSFDDGTALQTVTIPGSLNATFDLQWDAAWPAAHASVPDELGMALYTMSGSLVATSHQVLDSPDYGFVPEIALSAPLSATATQYQLAIYQIGPTAVDQFKYIIFGSPGTIATADSQDGFISTTQAQDPGGIIDDPAAGQGSGSVHGHQLVPGANTVGAAYWANSPAYGVAPDWTEYFSSSGSGELLFDQNGNRLATPVSDGKVNFVAPDGIQTSVPGFQGFSGTSAAAPDAAAVAALMLQADPSLTTGQVTNMLEASAVSMNLPAATQGAGLIQAPGAVQLAVEDSALCFCGGTLIDTPTGEVPVERLEVGQSVLTASGKSRPIVWIAAGRVLVTRGHRSAATPVVVRKGALADNVPHRDLHVTKGHSVYWDGALIPVEFLVNHRSILWDDNTTEVTIFHIELQTHDVLLANGAPMESYRDDGNRWLFQNAASGSDLPPQVPCAPVLTGGKLVDAAWWRILDRTGPRSPLPLTDEPGLRLLADETPVEPSWRDGSALVFALAAVPDSLRIVSRAAAPAELGIGRDPRSLGVAVRQIVLRQGTRFRVIKAPDERLTDGFHCFEPAEGIRWTTGDARLPASLFAGFKGTLELVLHLGGTAQYLSDSVEHRAA